MYLCRLHTLRQDSSVKLDFSLVPHSAFLTSSDEELPRGEDAKRRLMQEKTNAKLSGRDARSLEAFAGKGTIYRNANPIA